MTAADRVTKTIVVEVPAGQAFEVFTAGFDSWWPRSHHTGGGDLVEAIIEPRPGGRWYGRSTVGEEEWGRVLEWEPPERILLDWQLNAEFKYEADFHTDIEVRFIPESPHRTRVEFQHRNLDRYGPSQEKTATALGSEGGWTGILEAFRSTANKVRTG